MVEKVKRDIWDSTNISYATKIHERFVATSNGLYAMYPATKVNEDFNHMATDWYNAALAQKSDLVLTPPRNNEFGRCDVITIARTILAQSVTSGLTDTAVGVAGVNVHASFMETMLMEHVPFCNDHKYRWVNYSLEE